MLILSLFQDPINFIGFLIALIIAISFHEFAHAWLAHRFGDPTPRINGRITLNPVAHLDPYGTLFLLLAGIGWGKPVEIDPRYFKRPVLDEVLTALAGPTSNLVLAVIFSLIIRFATLPSLATNFFLMIVEINLLLMVFNFLPIPPLDGSKLLKIFLSQELYLYLQRVGILILVGVLVFSAWVYPILPIVIQAVLSFFNQLLLGTPETFFR